MYMLKIALCLNILTVDFVLTFNVFCLGIRKNVSIKKNYEHP